MRYLNNYEKQKNRIINILENHIVKKLINTYYNVKLKIINIINYYNKKIIIDQDKYVFNFSY